jgi:hypothetical protein
MAFPFIIFTLSPFAENSMDQDVYGGYNKQQIGSLTTDGEGELTFSVSYMSGISEKKRTDLQPTCNNTLAALTDIFTLFFFSFRLLRFD